MTMYEPGDDRRTDRGVEFDEFVDLPIIHPEDVEPVQHVAGDDADEAAAREDAERTELRGPLE